MAGTLITASFDREVTLAEVRARLSEINLRHALSVLTKLSSRHLWFPDSPELARYTNLVNLSLLAKATVLYASDTGRGLDLSDTSSNDLRWLLMAVNSMQWFSRTEVDRDRYEAITSFLMRQGYARNFLGDHPVATIGRPFLMFYEHLSRSRNDGIDVDAAMTSAMGVTCHDLWVLAAAIYAFYFIECAKEKGPWVFSADGFVDAAQSGNVTARLKKVLAQIARTPEELRRIYSADQKYRHDGLPDEYWCSEFNILRDYPIITLGPDQYCCPFPVFAWMRGTIGYYFDLANHCADLERKHNPRNPNPLDNDMSRLLGDVFQEYVGEQLRSLPALAPHLHSEFVYAVGKQELRTPDWIIDRQPTRPVFIECKARRPALPLQTRCNSLDREKEIRAVVARAIGQLCVFLRNLRANHVPALINVSGEKCIYALVLYESFPFHALPRVRQAINDAALALAPEWAQLRADVTFVPLSVQELEFALRIEQEKKILIEDQLAAYARYRESAPFMVDWHGAPRFSQHFGDFVNDKWGSELKSQNRLLVETWKHFGAFLVQHLYGENWGDYKSRCRHHWIKEAAYFRWLNAGRPDGTHLSDWFASVEEFEALEAALEMPPYQYARLKEHYQMKEGFSGLTE
jgi:hypothetical protein